MKPMTEACGCCEGIEIVTPEPTANRPGLTALSYRIGTHAAFLETMLARLSGSDYPKLAELRTRETDDPAIALLDAWAVIADVLTFYNERIINEGYLRTATERRSILEMARLVGYQLRPGVASSVYLAYTVDDNFKEEAIIAKGAKSQSIPGPNELPQTFETSEDLKARAQWNNLKPRMTRPQTQTSIQAGIEIDDKKYKRIYIKGINTNLNINDPLLIDYEGNNDPDTIQFNRVKELRLEPEENRTLVILQSDVISIDAVTVKDDQTKNHKDDIGIIEELTKPASVQPENSLKLPRNLQDQFGRSLSSGGTVKSLTGNSLTSGEASSATLKSFAPMLKNTLSIAQANAEVTESNNIKVYALRAKAGFFGHNYPGLPISVPISGENRAFITVHVPVPHIQLWPADLLENAEEEGLKKIIIEPQNEKIQKEGWIVIERPILEINPNESGFIFSEAMAAASSSVRLDLNGLINSIRDQHCKVSGQTHTIHKVQEVQQINQQSQNPLIGINAKVDLLTIEKPWLTEDLTNIEGLLDCVALLKESVVYTQSEKLELAEEVIGDTVCGGANQMIELDGFYDGLETGRWVMVSGEREIAGTSGVKFSELAMLSSVRQDIRNLDDSGDLQGDKLHTFIKLANELSYCFKRDTVTIYGNVVKATHGDTRKETLGSGDGAKALQSFVLKQPPLTHVPASKPSGVDSTLRVFVNDVRWDETDALTGLSPADRYFITKTDDDGKTTVIFGNGREGARLPTGIENIKAEYRNGIGKPGNVKTGQISLPITRPLGVKEVINPLPASGGADKESRDQARKNAPLAVKALDRLVSVQDYEDFARVYAGVGKARAAELSNGRRQLVHVTIAGSDDIPIDKNSDLYRNLRQSLLDFGDPFQPLQLEIRELMFIVIQANIRILPDYQWEPVVTQVRSALLGAFSFERRELGQDVVLSEVLGVMQAVRGVAYVDVDAFGGIPEKQFTPGKVRQLLTPAEIAERVQKFVTEQLNNRPAARLTVNLADFEPEDHDQIHPAQLAFLTPEVSETLILNQIH